MWKIFDLSESPTVDFQITGRGKVTTETHSFLCMYDNFNKLLEPNSSPLQGEGTFSSMGLSGIDILPLLLCQQTGDMV
ncbi:MAG: hypothetical protein WB870_16905, partial [Gallionellaceae bacterium]